MIQEIPREKNETTKRKKIILSHLFFSFFFFQQKVSSPRQRKHQAGKFVEAHEIVGALCVVSDMVVNLLIRIFVAEGFKTLVELLNLIEVKNTVAVHIHRIEQLTNLRLRHRQAANVVLKLVVRQVTVVVVAGNQRTLHFFYRSGLWEETQ